MGNIGSDTCAAVEPSQEDEQEREAQQPGHGGGKLVSERSGPDSDIYTPVLRSTSAEGELQGPVMASRRRNFRVQMNVEINVLPHAT